MTETCDRCGPAVRAGYRVNRVGELYLIGPGRHRGAAAAASSSRMVPLASASATVRNTASRPGKRA
jgi:hypothetical protein